MSESTLNLCYPDGIIGNGIFTDLQKLDVPWKSKNINTSLDIAYYGKNSGQKIVSPFIDNFTADDSPVISDVNRAIIAKCLFDVYGENWKHLWDTTQQEYNMLWNTDATIEVDTTNSGKDSRTSSGTDSGTDTHILSGTDTTTKDLTDTHTLGGNDTDTTTKDLTDTHTLGGSDTDATTKDLTDTHTLGGKDTDTLSMKGTNTDKETGTDKNKGNDVTYHHQKTIQFHPADKNTSTVTNKTAGYNGSDFANDTQQTTVDNTAVLTHTYTDNSDKNPYVDAKGKDDAWKNSDETDSERTETKDLTTTHELNETDTTTHSYGKTDTETIKGKDTTTYTYGKTDTETIKGKDTTTYTYGKTDTETIKGTDTTTYTYGKTDTETIQGTDSTTHSYGKTDTETIKGTDTATTYGRTDAETMSNTNSSTENGTNDFTGKETTRRTGNIGVTSNQQMIQAERDLWKWNFFSQIFADVDRYLTLAVY